MKDSEASEEQCLEDPTTEHKMNYEITTVITYYHTNTPLNQSECAEYISYFIKPDIPH